MGQYFSTLDIADSRFYIPGRADEETLANFEPLQEWLMQFTTEEPVYFWLTPSMYISGDEGDDVDMPVDRFAAFLELLPALENAGLILYGEPVRFEMNGVLDKPFEDFYELTGEARAEYLEVRAERKRLEQVYLDAMRAQGASEEEIKDGYNVLYEEIYEGFFDTDDEESEEASTVAEPTPTQGTGAVYNYAVPDDDDLVLPGE